MDPRSSRSALPKTVLALGVVSFFTDVSSEMIFPLLPAFLAARLPAAPLLLGAMEGLADLVSAGIKIWAGRLTDRSARLRPLVFAGYGLSTFFRPLMAFVGAWWQPLVVRSLDRVGKGLRGAPRDVLIASWAGADSRGRAFGFHRAMDHGGAAVGALIASVALFWGASMERIFLFSAIPGALALVAISFSKEAPAREPKATQERLDPIPSRLYWYLAPVALFSLANATEAFLLLRLSEQGLSAALLPVAWLVLHFIKSVISTPAGRLADSMGSQRLVPVGWLLFSVSYVALALSPSWPWTVAAMALFGLHRALAEGAEKSLLVELSPVEARGRAFGLFHALTGLGALGAGLAFGGLWLRWGPSFAFLLAGGLSALAAALLVLWLPRARASAA